MVIILQRMGCNVNLLQLTVSSFSLFWKHKKSKTGSECNEKSSNKSKPCDDQVLEVHLAQIQAVSPEDIVNLATLDELEIICR